MALNLSTLTNSATSGGILAEALTTADFLDPCPILKNLARGSNKGGDAKQTTAVNQPRALPLIKNPSGNLGGYLYIPNVSGNYATGPSVTIGANQTWEGELDMVITQWGNYIMPMGGGDWALGFGILFYNNGFVNTLSKAGPVGYGATGITLGTPFNVKYGFNGTDIYADIDGVRKFTETASSQAASITHTLELNQQTLTNVGNYAIQKAKLTVNNAVVFDCDFNGSTSIRHGDTKFNCVGGPVSLTRAGQDPITVVKKGVLRFDGVNDFFTGLLGQSINSGHIFVSFSWLGSGGDSWARPFGVHKTGELDYASGGFVLRRFSSTENLIVTQNSSTLLTHLDMVDSELGDMLVDFKISSGDTDSKINNADLKTSSATTDTDASNFNIAAMDDGQLNAAIDLEYLALFPASITDAEANRVRDFINTRNNVFDLKDGFGYYFYDAQKAPVGAITTGSASWNGRIVGSDNGDSASIIAQQATANDQPVGDGYVVTFADNTDHLDIPQVTLAAGDSYAWMVCGTSLGTFSYKVTVSGETELNLLGHLGDATYRKAGDLYGIVLLPESATSADIEQARSLLIDRGAADGTSDGSITYYWRFRTDIVDFKAVDMSSATSVFRGWDGCSSMNSFGITQLSNCSNFTNAWRSCSSLQSFPAGAKLGTAASGVNFTSAWRSSGLTSFSTPLPKATVINYAWESCTYLTSFDLESLPLVTNAAYSFEDCTSISSFSSSFYVCKTFIGAWNANVSLADFSADVFANWNPSTLIDGCFNGTWVGCTSLTANSVEAILTSIDASNQHGTDDGTSTGNPLGDSGIDIDYDGTTLSAATNTAVDSLKAKGWVIVVNGVTL